MTRKNKAAERKRWEAARRKRDPSRAVGMTRTEDVGLDADQAAGLADAEVQLLRDLGLRLRFDPRLIHGWPVGNKAILCRNGSWRQLGGGEGNGDGAGRAGILPGAVQ